MKSHHIHLQKNEENATSQRALFYLLNIKKLNKQDALAILSDLSNDQREALTYGLEKKDVQDLNKDEIEAIIYYHFSHDEVKGLNKEQIIAAHNLHLSPDILRHHSWLKTSDQRQALGYLLFVKKYSLNEAALYLSSINSHQAKAICYGICKEELVDLQPFGIEILIEAKKFAGLKNRTDILDLNPIQIKLVQELYAYGMTGSLIREHGFLATPTHYEITCYLVKDKLMSIPDVLTAIKNINEDKLKYLKQGLAIDDVKILNIYQAKALLLCENSLNGLSSKDFINKAWFNSDMHVNALHFLLRQRYLDIKTAMAELNDLSPSEAKLISEGEERDNFINLNQWMQFAIKDNKQHGLKGHHLRDKTWFKTDLHCLALKCLINQKGHFVEDLLTQLEKLNQTQLTLLTYNIAIEKINNLNYVQIELVKEIPKQYFCLRYEEIIEASWFNEEKHLDAFKLLYSKMIIYPYNAFKILNLAIGQKRLDELLLALASYPGHEWDKCPDINQLSFFKAVKNKKIEKSYAFFKNLAKSEDKSHHPDTDPYYFKNPCLNSSNNV